MHAEQGSSHGSECTVARSSASRIVAYHATVRRVASATVREAELRITPPSAFFPARGRACRRAPPHAGSLG
uniref:Uncharacterized protein n=1 Tax=Tanacetum cinerariifolium TaxID=118510 RepID=A0A699WWG7_TANCI|nr:hypothetical protein [Tanacetum cinerariifolium]